MTASRLQGHDSIENRADEVLNPPYVSYNGQVIKDALDPANTTGYAGTLADFQRLYSFPPPGCADKAHDPAPDWKSRWYADSLSRPGEGVAHAYVRQTAEITHAHMPYIECIDTSDDKAWSDVGYFTGRRARPRHQVSGRPDPAVHRGHRQGPTSDHDPQPTATNYPTARR